jgi:hypothetical protein
LRERLAVRLAPQAVSLQTSFWENETREQQERNLTPDDLRLLAEAYLSDGVIALMFSVTPITYETFQNNHRDEGLMTG